MRCISHLPMITYFDVTTCVINDERRAESPDSRPDSPAHPQTVPGDRVVTCHGSGKCIQSVFAQSFAIAP